jgi:hypothetical protein
MILRIGGQELPVAQMGPDFLILKEPATGPAGQGVVTLTVDGISEEIPVNLPQGISLDSRRITIAEVEAPVALAEA